jgi:hypothetical protein
MSTAPTGPAPDPPPPASAPTPGEATPRRALVLLMIMATAGLFVGLFAVLYFRWSGAQEPSSALVVSITPAFGGAESIVDGIALTKPYRVRVDARRGKSIPFYLDRGSYTLRVMFDERQIYASDFILDTNRMLKIDLSQFEDRLPTTAPAVQTTPADDAAVLASSRN